MDEILKQFEQIINHMGQEVYIYLGLFILLIFLIIHLYSLSQEKKKLRNTVQSNVEIFQRSFDISRTPLLVLSDKYEIIYANKSMVTLLELKENFLSVGLDPMPEIKVNQEWKGLRTFIEENHTRTGGKVLTSHQYILRVTHGKILPINLHIDTLFNEKNEKLYSKIISIQDMTQAKKNEKTLYTHKVTNIPNQLQAFQDFPALYSKIHLENNKIALVLISFDNFTRLRSIIGYEQATTVLIKFSEYLQSMVSDMNVAMYHTFDNHFLLTVSNLNSADDVIKLVEDIQLKLTTFYRIEDVSLHLTISAGISLYPDSGPTRKLLDNAYKALESAQKAGESKISVFLENAKQNKYDELALHNDMQGGLERGEFEVYYQPIVSAENYEIIAAEALIRWIHPEYGFIPSDVFIPLMEKTGFIIKLGQFVLEEVLKQHKRWELFKFKQISISINVSMVEISSGKFVEHLEKQLAHHQVNPEVVKFEITEGLAMISEVEMKKYFLVLKKLGVSLALDDFGTGYTSFSYLKKFPADTVKIDKSMVDYILSSEEDQRIVKAMIELGHNLGMKVVVEGIENKKMADLLASYGCDYMQGYYFAKPLPVFEFQKSLR